jgi:hypothetical protein
MSHASKLVLIPARMAATRLPGGPDGDIAGLREIVRHNAGARIDLGIVDTVPRASIPRPIWKTRGASILPHRPRRLGDGRNDGYKA